MWFEEPPQQRVSNLRAEEAIATGAQTVATACPFCLNMGDGMASTPGGEQVRMLDIAELFLDGRVPARAEGSEPDLQRYRQSLPPKP